MWVGGGHLSPVPRLWGWSVCPSSSIPLLLPLQIPCRLVVAKLISNSCAPPSPTDSEKLKRAPVPSLLPCWAYVKKYKIQWNLCPFFSKVWTLLFFHNLLFQMLSPPPTLPLTRLCCFSEQWANSDLHCNCCAPPPPPHPHTHITHMGTLPKHQGTEWGILWGAAKISNIFWGA